jgi:CelD/BcsL family acetyltransferase involved in cellulose biosynthesis
MLTAFSHFRVHARRWVFSSTAGSASLVKITVHNRLENLADLWPRHGHSSDGGCYVFQSTDLIDVWCDTVGAARRISPQFVDVRDTDGSPLMLLPLGIERRHGVRLLSFLDASIADYNIPVLFPHARDWTEDRARAVWSAVMRALPPVDVVVLDKMPSSVAGRQNPLILLGATSIGVSGHAARLSGITWREYEETRLPRRRTLRRYRRKLEEFGPVRFEIPESADRREAILEAMVRQKERRFDETGATGFDSPGKRAFFLEAGRRLAGGPVHLSALVVGDEIVATHLGYVFDRRFYQIMPTYEAGHWQSLSVGRLLHEDLIRWSFEHGMDVFDFGVGDEAYKSEYCDEVLPLQRLVIPVSGAGRLHLAAGTLRERIRGTRIWKRIRDLKNGRRTPPSETSPES